jgi:rare lipoprotein A
MRTSFAFAAVAIAALMTAVAPASASWECTGPAFACDGGSSSKASKPSYKKTASKKSKPSYSSNSDSGSSGGYTLSGKASYYWQPQALASGGRFNPNAMTAAHKTLPFGTKVRVTNLNNGKSVTVTINDRGPYVAGRIIDLSKAAAHSISMQGSGVVPVKVAVLGKG